MMKLTVDRVALVDILGRVELGVKKPTLFPLTVATVVLSADADRVTVVGQQDAVFVRAGCPATVTEAGGTGLGLHTLLGVLKAMDSETVTLACANRVDVSMAGGHILATQKQLSLPKTVPSLAESEPIIIAGLKNGLDHVAHAQADEESRPVLYAVAFQHGTSGNEVALVAADGFRLGLATANVVSGTWIQDIVVPYPAVTLLRELMRGDVAVMLDQPHILFRCQESGVEVIALLVNATYPNYERLIPEDGTKLDVGLAPLRAALGATLAIVPDGGVVRLQTKTPEVLSIWAESEECAKVEAQIPCEGECRIAFNGRYLEEALSRCGDSVTMYTTTTSSPALITSDSQHREVLMPMFVVWPEE